VLLLAAILNSILSDVLGGSWLSLCSAIVSVLFVIIGSYLQKHFDDANLVLNVATTSLIACGILLANYFNISPHVESLFFGDILLVSIAEMTALLFLAAFLLWLIYKNFTTLVIAALNEEIAISQGTKVGQLKLAILLIAAVSISLIVKIIGGLTISSLTIVPAFFAKIVSRTPQQMLLNSIIFAVSSSLAGLGMAFWLDFALAPSIAVIEISGLFLTLVIKRYIF
jgi:zinc transport system permease protein